MSYDMGRKVCAHGQLHPCVYCLAAERDTALAHVTELEAKLDIANVDIGGKHNDVLRLTRRSERLDAKVMELEAENARLREELAKHTEKWKP